LGRARLVIGDIVNPVAAWTLDGCHQHLRDVGGMDAVEYLSRLDDAPSRSICDIQESVAS
jgi:hypothetical protein